MMDDNELNLAEMIATNSRDVPDMMQRLVDEVREYRSRTEATLEQSDADEGIVMLREANASFGNYTAAAPGIPELKPFDNERLRDYAGRLASLAALIKAEAAEANGTGRPMLGLLLIRIQLSVEETGEFAEALADGDLVHAAKELTDIQYVTDGHYLTLGLGDLKLPLYREVHASNMTKLDPVTGKPNISEAGRWLKGPSYREANVAAVIHGK